MLYITDADVRAANARRRGILVVPPTPPADLRAMLVKKRLVALVAGGARRRTGLDRKGLPGTQGLQRSAKPRRRAPGSRVLATIKLTGTNVLASERGDWVGGVADTLVASGYPDLAGLVRKRALAARIATASGPRSLVASARDNAVPVSETMMQGLAYSADGNRCVSIVVPR